MFIREPINALTHLSAMAVAVPATLFLLRLTRGDTVKFVGMLVYGVSLICCYAGSGLFHSVAPEHSDTFAMLDHIGIYLLIAGTVTPIGLIVLHGNVRLMLLSGIWLMAATGITLRILCEPSLAVRTSFYLAMGWIGCTMYFQLVSRLSHAKVSPMWIGGLLYSVGAAINLLDFPATVNANICTPHQVFHVFVIGGSVAHFYFMLGILIPYRRTQEFPVADDGEAIPAPVVVLSDAATHSSSALSAGAR